jgi:hypothetical protein
VELQHGCAGDGIFRGNDDVFLDADFLAGQHTSRFIIPFLRC